MHSLNARRVGLDAGDGVTASRTDPLEVDVVSDPSMLPGLARDWERLVRLSGIGHPFMGHAWTCSWWRAFGANHRLHVVVIRSGNVVRGIAPLMEGSIRMYGRSWRRIGSLYDEQTPWWFDVIASPTDDAVFDAFWRHLERISTRWDVLDLLPLRAGSPTYRALRDSARRTRLRPDIRLSHQSPWLRLAESWDEFQRGLSKKHRSTVRRRLRRLGELGRVDLELVCNADEDVLLEGFRIEAAAWKGAAGSAILSAPPQKNFYTNVAKCLEAQNALRLYFLNAGGRRIAFSYCIEFSGTLFLLKVGYDPGYARYSPVNVMAYLMLERLHETRSVIGCDMLGKAEPWKLSWSRQTTEATRLQAFSRTPGGRCLRAVKLYMVPLVKSVISLTRPRRRIRHA